jgi:hypothetical protein
MGLFMDPNGIPVSYRLFDGSCPDQSTLKGALETFKAEFGASKVTVVADGAMNTSPGVGMLHALGDGWVVSSSIRKASKALKAWVADREGWVYQTGPDGRVWSMTKSQIRTRQVDQPGPGGTTVKTTVQEKVIARWSAAHAARQAQARSEMAAKAAALVADPAKLKASNRRGVKKYVKQEQADKTTGEVTDAAVIVSLDEAKLVEDAQWDGYWLCHTSQTDTPDAEVLAQYRQLWRIEENFRVSKTDLQARPVYVWTPKHIEAHFLVCFLALLLTRLLQAWAGGLPSGRLRELLVHMVATEADDGLLLQGRPAGWQTIDTATGVDTDRKWVTVEALRQRRRSYTRTFAEKSVTLHHTTRP